MGIAGFGHEFKALEWYPSPVMNVFEEFCHHEDDLLSKLTIFIGAIFPVFLKFPTNRARLTKKYQKALSQTAKEIIRELEKMTEKSADDDTEFGLDDMVTNNLFIIAGFETMSTTITWALIELARNPDVQQKLREELEKYPDSDPNWDQLKTELHYLDAVVQETFRLHPSVELTMRAAAHDDILPLSNPMATASGEVVDSVTIEKGTMVITPYIYFNTSEELWGPDSKQFKPERWLSEMTVPAKENHGYRHIYIFSDGPRFCLGKDFAYAELKTTLSVLIRNYTFELPDGPDTVFEYHRVFVLRSKPVGNFGAVTPTNASSTVDRWKSSERLNTRSSYQFVWLLVLKA
ncbi:Cytochrome P450 [Amanita muscaria]